MPPVATDPTTSNTVIVPAQEALFADTRPSAPHLIGGSRLRSLGTGQRSALSVGDDGQASREDGGQGEAGDVNQRGGGLMAISSQLIGEILWGSETPSWLVMRRFGIR